MAKLSGTCATKKLVKHWQEILPIIRLADIEIYITADTDNRSDVYVYQTSTNIW